MQIARQEGAGADPQDVDVPGGHELVHHRLKGGAVDPLDGLADGVHVPVEDGGHHVGAEQGVIGRLNPLDGGELAADDLLEGPLHGGVTVIAQLRGKAHHGGLADSHQLPQLAGGHKGRLVVVGQDIGGNPLLPLGQLRCARLNGM